MGLIKLSCKYHPHANLIEDFVAGDLICPVCGLIVGDRVIDFSSEWRSFANDGDGEDSSRVGAVENANNSEATTSITIKGTFDAKHMDENGNLKYKNQVVISPTERMLSQCRNHISALGDRLKANGNIISYAISLSKRLSDLKEFRRKNKEAISCACLYIAFREKESDRSIADIGRISNATEKEISKMYKNITAALKITSKIANINSQVPLYHSRLKLKNFFIQKLASEIVGLAKQKIFKKPITMIATSLYMASMLMKEDLTKKKIRETMNVSEATLTATYKIFYQNRNEIIPTDLIPRLAITVDELPESPAE